MALAGDLSASMVADVVPGVVASDPRDIVAVGGTLFFTATDPSHGRELWKSDGTVAGTSLVKDINPGRGDSDTYQLTAVGNTLYFSATDGRNGQELWKSDGTAAGTVMVRNINEAAGFGSNPQSLTAVNGTLFFSAANSVRYPQKNTNGGWPVSINYELWKSDGTASGTVLVKDIAKGDQNSNPESLVNYNGKLYFRAWQSRTGSELWMSNGTSSGTVLVKDVLPGAESSWPDQLTVAGSRLAFTTISSADMHGELWTTNGTPAGTSLIKSFPPATAPSQLTALNGRLAFLTKSETGVGLWSWNSAGMGASLVRSFANASVVGTVADRVFLSADDGLTGNELWVSDGTAAGTRLVKDIAPGLDAGALPRGSSPSAGRSLNGRIYFAADDGVYGQELWQSDGTAAGTSLVRDVQAGSAGSAPAYFSTANNNLYFAATDLDHGRELWQLPAETTASPTILATASSHCHGTKSSKAAPKAVQQSKELPRDLQYSLRKDLLVSVNRKTASRSTVGTMAEQPSTETNTSAAEDWLDALVFHQLDQSHGR